jgi:type I restriction enzyme S subunit
MKDEMPSPMPKLRFREFTEPWNTIPLKALAVPVSDRVGTSECVPYTVTSGVGLVSQDQKFGRTIAGKSLSNYIRLQKHDFAYNKSATKAYPEGYITRHLDDVRAAVPNSIFTCFRVDPKKIDPAYLDFLFAGNLHGRWLRKFLTVGARAHGSLNVNDDDLMALPVPLAKPAEQLKIAACLTSLDDCIASEGRKLEALETHKKGLIQQLFPRQGESRPRLRFPEFADAGEWEEKTLGDIAAISSGTTPLRANPAFYEGGTIPWVKTTDLNNSFIDVTEECITPNARATVNPIGSVIVAMYGGFKQIGRTGLLRIPAATNQALSVLQTRKEEVLPIYLLTWLNAKVDDWKRIASSSRKDPNVTGSDVARFTIQVPAPAEQQRIAACVSSLDTLIAAQSRKLDALRAHKKGLMQQLFPSTEE